jgi:hypothetical protein
MADPSRGSREMVHDRNPQKAGKVMWAMLQMIELDIATLQQAFDRRVIAAARITYQS